MSTNSHQRSLAKRLWYDFLRIVCRSVFLAVYRIRSEGREHIPRAGGALVLSNHQSHFDPIIVGLGSDRRMNYLARETLFRFPPFRWLIRSLDAIPIDREGLGLNGLKETLRRIKRGELVLMFPEGTRTPNGEVHALKPGFCALARRLNVPLVPVGVDGAFDAWPRTRTFPRGGRIHVQYGAPILPEEIARFEERDLVAEVERRIRACHATARRQLVRRAGRRLDLVRVPE